MSRTMAAFLTVSIFAAAVFSQDISLSPKIMIAVYVTGNMGENEKKALGTKILVELVNSGKYRAVERSDDFIKELNREQSKQMDGTVDDNQITKIGKQFGVQVICVADLTQAFGGNQISARLIDVESAEIMAIADVSSRLTSIDDLAIAAKNVVRGILGPKKSKKPQVDKSAAKTEGVNAASETEPAKSAKPPKPAPPEGYADFTDKERLKTYGLNWVPGLGSFRVMKDNVGGYVLVGTAVTGAALLFSGIKVNQVEHEYIYPSSGTYYTDEYSVNSVFWIGCGILAGGGVFNIVRSATYHKPFSKTAAGGADGFYVALLPDRYGGFSTSVRYGTSF